MREYTLLAVLSVLGVVALELFWVRTGVLRTAQYWIAMAIVFVFQVVVDGWLTKLSAPIVLYDEEDIIGVRVPWDIPVEDYLFGFSMITLTLLTWLHVGRRETRDSDG
ncbi:MAG TPA: lycopene cyclase domain-containing protein, partial [Ornithinibacter sp.]|nr:lycopene cyclase domain-containing protein [Ornithinibacter sp.]